MKLRNIFTALAVAALAFVGCQEGERFLDEVQVSQSTVSIDVEGGSAEITVTANFQSAVAVTVISAEPPSTSIETVD